MELVAQFGFKTLSHLSLSDVSFLSDFQGKNFPFFFFLNCLLLLYSVPLKKKKKKIGGGQGGGVEKLSRKGRDMLWLPRYSC